MADPDFPRRRALQALLALPFAAVAPAWALDQVSAAQLEGEVIARMGPEARYVTVGGRRYDYVPFVITGVDSREDAEGLILHMIQTWRRTLQRRGGGVLYFREGIHVWWNSEAQCWSARTRFAAVPWSAHGTLT